MKRKGNQEILKATNPDDIFTMDLNIIEREKEEYLSKYKPDEYKAVEHSVITKKIILLYAQAISILNGNGSAEDYTKIDSSILPKKDIEDIAKANYEIAKSIKESFSTISDSIRLITDEIERNNKLNEVYMLEQKIEKIEDELIEKGLLKMAYSKLTLSPIKQIELADNEIRLLASVLSDATVVNDIINLSIKNSETPLSTLATSIPKYLIRVYDATFDIPDLNIVLFSDNNCICDSLIRRELFGPKFEYLIRNKDGDDYTYYTSDSSELKYLASYTEFKNFAFIQACRDVSYLYNKNISSCNYQEEDIPLIKRELKRTSTIYFRVDKEQATYLIKLASQYNPPTPSRIIIIENAINSINMDLQITSLRNLYHNLNQILRDFKIKEEIF